MGLFALPGGFIRKKENLDDAAKRILQERTGLKNICPEQSYIFGNPDRDDKVPMQKIMKGKGLITEKDHWLLRRFVSVGYYALVDYTKAIPNPDVLSYSCKWYDLSGLPSLMLDRSAIVEKALETFRLNLDRKLIVFNLMPETFAIIELQKLYETVLGQKLLPTNFQRKMPGLGILQRIAKKLTGGAHKAPCLYRFTSGKRKR